MSERFATCEEVAELLRVSVRTVHGLASSRLIPHRRLPRQRRLLFVVSEVEAWVLDPGLPLEVEERDHGARVVRPKGPTT